MPQDPVSEIIFQSIPRIARNAFLYYLANVLLLLLLTSAVTFIFGSTGFPFNGFFAIFGFVITIYAGVVWAWTRSRLSKGLSNQFYLLAVLGVVQASVLGSAAAYQLVSAGYWMRQAWSRQACKCTHDNGEVVSVEGKYLACSKCSRKLSVGFDIPKPWTRVGNIALLFGVALYALFNLVPSFYLMDWLRYLTWLSLINGIVFSSFKFTSQMQSGRYARLSSDAIGTS